MHINWLWLAVGFLPYCIKRQHTKDTQIVSVRALFWGFTIRRQSKKCSWNISIPLITHLKP